MNSPVIDQNRFSKTATTTTTTSALNDVENVVGNTNKDDSDHVCMINTMYHASRSSNPAEFFSRAMHPVVFVVCSDASVEFRMRDDIVSIASQFGCIISRLSEDDALVVWPKVLIQNSNDATNDLMHGNYVPVHSVLVVFDVRLRNWRTKNNC